MNDMIQGMHGGPMGRANGSRGEVGNSLLRGLLIHRSRFVSARVREDGREVDRLESWSLQGLRAALIPIVDQLSARGTLSFQGVEELRFLGFVISRRETFLADYLAASAFLASAGRPSVEAGTSSGNPPFAECRR